MPPLSDLHGRWRLAAAVSVLALLGLALRLPGFPAAELWTDDAWVALQQRAPFDVAIHMGLTSPGFNALESLWISMRPGSAAWAQVLPLAVSVATVPIAAGALRWATGSWTTGVVSAGILALSPIGITYATRVKQYPFDALLALLVLAIGLRMVLAQRSGEELSRRLLWVGCWIGAVAVLISAATAPMVAIGLGLPVLLRLRRPDGRPSPRSLAPLLLPAASVILVALLVVRPLPPSLHGYWAFLLPDWSAGPRPFVRSVGTSVRGVFEGLYPLPGLLGLLLSVSAAALLLRRRPSVAALLLAPFGVALVLLCLRVSPLGGGRIDMWLYPSLAVLVGCAAAELVRAVPRLPAWPAVTVALAALLAATVAQDVEHYPATNVRAQLAYIERERLPGDQVLVAPLAVYTYAWLTDEPLDFRVDRREATNFGVDVRGGETRLTSAAEAAGGAAPCGNAPRIWSVSVGPDLVDDQLRRCGYQRRDTPVRGLGVWLQTA